MSKAEPAVTPHAELRRRAETKLQQLNARVPDVTKADPQRLIQELEIHQIELEIQNEELRASRAEAEWLLARYSEVFEFAPIGYAVLGGDGAIREINLAGALLFGAERKRLIGKRLGALVGEGERAAYNAFFGRLLMGDEPAPGFVASCEVAVPKAERETCDLRLMGRLLQEKPVTLLVSLEDVTARRRAEAALATRAATRTSFSPCSRTSCEIRSRQSGTASTSSNAPCRAAMRRAGPTRSWRGRWST